MPVIWLLLASLTVWGHGDHQERRAIELIIRANEKVQDLNPQPPECSHCSGNIRDLDVTGSPETENLLMECLKKTCLPLPKPPAKNKKEEDKQLNAMLEPFKKSLNDLINSERELYARSEEVNRRLTNSNTFKRPDMQVLMMRQSFRRVGQNLGYNDIGALDVREDDLAGAMEAEFALVLPEADRRVMSTYLREVVQDRRLRSSSLLRFGAPYKYRNAFPNLNYQEAVRTDLRETAQMLASAPPYIREAAKKMGIQIELTRLNARFVTQREFSDEMTGRQVSRVTDEVRWLMAGANFRARNPELSQRLSSGMEQAWRDYQKVTEGEYTYQMVIDKLDPRLKGLTPVEITKLAAAGDLARYYDTNPIPGVIVQNPPANHLSQTYAKCMQTIAATASSLPTASQIAGFQKRVPEIRRNLKRSLAGKFSSHSAGLINSYVDNVQITPPPAKDSYIRNALAELRSRTSANRESLALMDKDPTSAALRISIEDPDRGDDFPSTLGNICSRISFQPVRDATVTSLGAAYAGSESVRLADFGRGVTSHEIGHGIGHLFEKQPNMSGESRKKYEGVASCLAEMHKKYFDRAETINPNLPEDQRDPRPRDAYVNEDFADATAAPTSAKPNFACYLLARADDVRWDMFDPMDMKKDLKGSHSSELMRVLHVETASGRPLAPQCKQWLEQNSFDIKKCL